MKLVKIMVVMVLLIFRSCDKALSSKALISIITRGNSDTDFFQHPLIYLLFHGLYLEVIRLDAGSSLGTDLKYKLDA